jgi:hypothetical protein
MHDGPKRRAKREGDEERQRFHLKHQRMGATDRA